MQTFKRLYEPLCEPPMGPSRKLGQASVWGGLGCDLQDKNKFAGGLVLWQSTGVITGDSRCLNSFWLGLVGSG